MPQAPSVSHPLEPEPSAWLEMLRVKHAEIRATCVRQSREAIQMRQTA